MKRIPLYLALSFLWLISAQTSLGQESGLKISTGVASFRMDDLKSLQKQILSTYPVDGKITSSFPPFTAFSVLYFRQLYDQVWVGGGFSYSTTGGKSSYYDYSGYLMTEMTASSNRLGAYVAYSVFGGEWLDLSLFGTVDANLSSVTIQSSYTIQTLSNILTNKYRSISPTGTIGSEFSVKFQHFALGLKAGYLVDLTGKLKNTQSGESLEDPSDRTRILTTDWSGWTAQGTITIVLK